MTAQNSKAKILKAIKKQTKIIASARDELREILTEAEEICEDSEEAVRELENAIEYLSRNL
jgi:hypothetical protein